MSLSSRSSSSSGGGGGVRRAGYFAYRHPPGGGIDVPPDFNPYSAQENNFTTDNRGNRKMGSVSVQNGAINLHIPCAFSYALDVPVPPQPESFKGPSSVNRKVKPTIRRGTKKDPLKDPKCFSCTVPKEKESSISPRFCSTVQSGKLYKAPKIPYSSESSRTQNKTSVVWDMHAGERVPFQAVDYGQELYEEAAQNLARQLQSQKLEEEKEKKNGSVLSEVEENCHDFSKPKINSSGAASKALVKAVESLKNLPEEVESLLREDKRFEPIISRVATKVLNLTRSSKVYKDLIPVDPNPDVQTETENIIQAEIKRSIEAARQPSRTKDPEPKLDDFQTNSYTRIRPAPVPTPSKPPSGASVRQSHEFDTIHEENELEDKSNRM